MKSIANSDFTNMVRSAILSKYPGIGLSTISRKEKIGVKCLREIIVQRKVPKRVTVIRKISEGFDIDYSDLYAAYLRQGHPDILKWLDGFDINSCEFKDLIKYYRLLNGLSVDEMCDKLCVRRGYSTKYETGYRMPATFNIDVISKNLNIDEGIIRRSLKMQNDKADNVYRLRYGSCESMLLGDEPYVIDVSIPLNTAIRKRLDELDIRYSLFANEVGTHVSNFCGVSNRGHSVIIPKLSKVIAWLNLDLYSFIDSYRSSMSFEYLKTNFGNIVFIISACIGESPQFVSTKILHMSDATLRDYMQGRRLPHKRWIPGLSRDTGMDEDTLLNMFRMPYNYEYAKRYAYDCVRYVIQENYEKLNNLNVHVIKQLFNKEEY